MGKITKCDPASVWTARFSGDRGSVPVHRSMRRAMYEPQTRKTPTAGARNLASGLDRQGPAVTTRGARLFAWALWAFGMVGFALLAWESCTR